MFVSRYLRLVRESGLPHGKKVSSADVIIGSLPDLVPLLMLLVTWTHLFNAYSDETSTGQKEGKRASSVHVISVYIWRAQAFLLRCYILQMTNNWLVGRPGKLQVLMST